MKLRSVTPRDDWQACIASQGVTFWETELPDGSPGPSYWDDGTYVELDLSETTAIEAAAIELFKMLVAAGDWMLERPDFLARMGIPMAAIPAIKASWDREPALGSIYARFDLRFDGTGRVSMFEINPDTPTCLAESLAAQWDWFQAHFGEEYKAGRLNQWNDLYRKFDEGWRRNLDEYEKHTGTRPVIWFLYSDKEKSGEDQMNTATLRATAEKAGYETKLGLVKNLGRGEDGWFYYRDDPTDPNGRVERIDVAFKLYPWETLFDEDDEFALAMVEGFWLRPGTMFIEPPYKMLWSNKAVLVALWEMYKDDPVRSKYLLPAYFAEDWDPVRMPSVAIKPIFGREGANVTLRRHGRVVEDDVDGEYGKEGFIVQQLRTLPNIGTRDNPAHPVFGVWVIDGDVVGLGIRRSKNLVTDNVSTFACHVVIMPTTKALEA